MVNPNELRKKVGCWSCENCKVVNTATDSIASCASPDESIRAGFHGWDTAMTCKGFRMKPFTVSVKKDGGNG